MGFDTANTNKTKSNRIPTANIATCGTVSPCSDWELFRHCHIVKEIEQLRRGRRLFIVLHDDGFRFVHGFYHQKQDKRHNKEV